jgi:hypothetical protein
MHIVTLFFITCSDPTCMRKRERGMVCIRWSNLVVVVVSCDRILTCYGVYQFHGYLTRDKKNACAIFLVTAESPKLKFIDKCSIVICPSGSIFVVQHHVNVPN